MTKKEQNEVSLTNMDRIALVIPFSILGGLTFCIVGIIMLIFIAIFQAGLAAINNYPATNFLSHAELLNALNLEYCLFFFGFVLSIGIQGMKLLG